MQTIFTVAELKSKYPLDSAEYNEFLRVPDMSMGLYTIPAGAHDPQTPHTEDEVYYIVSGRGWITVGAEEIHVDAGTIVHVPALVDHRFHSVDETLQVLVFFAPAEYANADAEK